MSATVTTVLRPVVVDWTPENKLTGRLPRDRGPLGAVICRGAGIGIPLVSKEDLFSSDMVPNVAPATQIPRDSTIVYFNSRLRPASPLWPLPQALLVFPIASMNHLSNPTVKDHSGERTAVAKTQLPRSDGRNSCGGRLLRRWTRIGHGSANEQPSWLVWTSVLRASAREPNHPT